MDITCDIMIQTTVQKPCFQQWGDTLGMDWTHGTNNLRYHLGSPQREGYIPELATVRERLSTAGLTLKLKKCVFATKSLGYLGQCSVTVYGEVRSLIIPLTKLLRKKTEWGWSTDQETTFTTVKKILTIRPLLVYLNFSVPFRLKTDASKPSLCACLIQDCGDKSRPIAYASKVNRPAEETAVLWSLRVPLWYGLLSYLGLIVMDVALPSVPIILKWLMASPNLTGKLHRWALALQEFKFEVKYRPGSSSAVVEALSRVPVTIVACRRRSRQRVTDVSLSDDKEHHEYE
ncbi:protease, Reverse transcriptase, ribonuclease H, integrase [Phytophthora palmivora]|uniref:Protease, Reverse transcriptase, ribonuclease H, integrase n=1 Tax=Phytophthora palmivora TaxID=4796 RepID=A0A2P4Y8K1_9STRA|nr:protease, Reverse transcriptase, ribonuclease H, integrase [Phytophthora palmivora]